MTVKTYVLIDDDATGPASADTYTDEIVAAFGSELQIEVYQPTSLGEVLTHIGKRRPDGLLLDVALTNALDDAGIPLAFDGIALAQQIRTLQTRDELPEFPLVRFSKKDVIRDYVSGDTTSDDLFDEMIDKPEALSDPGHAGQRIHSLASDYPKVCAYARAEQTDEALADLLGVEPDYLARQDARVFLGLRRPDAPAHLLSRHLASALLARPGPLIDLPLLAIRLGVDVTHSGDDWEKLQARFTDAAYAGAFSSGYRRWWMTRLLDWWSANVDSDHSPNRLTATQRVEALQKRTGLTKLTPLGDDAASPGSKFWHFCVRSRRPVDPNLGFPLMPIWGQETWQDTDYLCLEEARRDSRNPRLRAAERSRLAALNAGKSAT